MIISNFGILEVFGHFLIISLTWDPETWFTGVLLVLAGACEKCTESSTERVEQTADLMFPTDTNLTHSSPNIDLVSCR